MSRLASVLLVAVLCTSFLAGCAGSRAPTLEREDLFSLDYGKMEDQLELFMNGGAMDRRISLHMGGGLFRIASGYGNKIMEFTSYGDLISLYYNADRNPAPILLQGSSDPGRMSNRQAYPFPFNVVGDVTVSPDGSLLVEDQVPARVAELDDELNVVLNRIVVRFDTAGNQIDYLGQEGIGGTYLPYIQRIETTTAGDIVVVTTAPPKTIVYWYAANGTLLRRIEVSPETYPVLVDRQAVPVLESIHADRENRRLYAKFDYHIAVARSELNGDEPDFVSRIYWLDISDGQYGGFVDVPENVISDSIRGERAEERFFQYEFIGTAPGENLFLLSQESQNTSQLLILNASGRVVRRRTLEIDYGEVVYRDLDISDAGILSGLLATREEVNVVWWRTDRLLPGRSR